MKITRENYEAYFIDYLEGVLDENMVDDFLEFLQQNPDLKEELALFSPVRLKTEAISFGKKEQLFREKFDIETEFDQAAIAQMEGDLPEAENEKFEKYLQKHPEKKHDVDLFRATRLIPDKSVVFGKKKSIYRYSIGKTALKWSVRIAAVFILAFSFYFLIDNYRNKPLQENQMAAFQNESPGAVEQPVNIASSEKNENTEIPETVQQEKNVQVAQAKKTKTPVQEIKEKASEKSPAALTGEGPAPERLPLPIPDRLVGLTASIGEPQFRQNLAAMHLSLPAEISPVEDDEHFLAEKIIEKTGLDKIDIHKISKAGLDFVRNISKDKFYYQTNNEGKVVEYNYDSRLLAFTIPVRNRDQK